MGDLAFLHNSVEALNHPQVTDRILFRRARDQTAGQLVFGWTGAWPPPEFLLIVEENSTHAMKVINPSDYEKVDWTWDRFEREQNCTVHRFRLNSASQIQRPAKPREKWFRGAEYLPTLSTPSPTLR